jgi:hypothetical protein
MSYYFGDNSTAMKPLIYRRHADGLRNLGGRQYNHQPTINILAEWPPHFAVAYQQFLNSGIGPYSGFPGGIGGHWGGKGGYSGGLQGVPIGFGAITLNVSNPGGGYGTNPSGYGGGYAANPSGYGGSYAANPSGYGGGYGAGYQYPMIEITNWYYMIKEFMESFKIGKSLDDFFRNIMNGNFLSNIMNGYFLSNIRNGYFLSNIMNGNFLRNIMNGDFLGNIMNGNFLAI